MKRREVYKTIIAEPAKSRIERQECPSCGKHKSLWTRRTDWRCCSTDCSENFYKIDGYITYNWQEVRRKALERDGYRCVLCNCRPIKLMSPKSYGMWEGWKDGYEEKNGVKWVRYLDDSKLIGDHIIPIALGGDEWDLRNVQTLCTWCSKEKTREDIKKIAELRRVEKKLVDGQKQLTY